MLLSKHSINGAYGTLFTRCSSADLLYGVNLQKNQSITSCHTSHTSHTYKVLTCRHIQVEPAQRFSFPYQQTAVISTVRFLYVYNWQETSSGRWIEINFTPISWRPLFAELHAIVDPYSRQLADVSHELPAQRFGRVGFAFKSHFRSDVDGLNDIRQALKN
jgi:hypothetical protein